MQVDPQPSERKARIQRAFDAIAGGYDELRFVAHCARRLVELAALEPGMRVLDLGAGTGLVSLAAARLVAPGGQVLGVDLSPQMLAQARRKAEALDLPNLAFEQGDAEHLALPDASFDVVLSASALFFVPDMPAAAREARRVLRPGGRFAFTSFGADFLQPLTGGLREHLARFGAELPGLPHMRLPTPQACEGVLRQAGFTQVSAHSEELGYYLTVEQRWAEVLAGLEGLPLAHLTPPQREHLRAGYVAELESLAGPQGVYVRLPALFAFGRQDG
jgi:ubiquinone/menaquinone biosynthesis C-methylase UbiE